MTLSCFFIVRNEARTIRRALASVLEVTGQYVIGIDDTSGDGTAEIVAAFAREHAEKVFDIYRFTWENDFSKARNAAIERCTGDWIFQLDGHEYLHPQSLSVLRRYLSETPENIWLISVRMWLEPIWGLGNDERELVIPEVWFIQSHLWRNSKGIRYRYASHNQITAETCPIEHRMNTPDIVIVHDRPHENAEARRQQRATMNTPYFQEQVKADPNSERGLFYLTMTYVDQAVRRGADGSISHDHRMLKKAVRYARRYLAAWGHIMPEQAFEMAAKLGEVNAELGDWDGAREAFFECLKLQPQRAEAYFHLGLVTMQQMERLTADYYPGGQLVEGRSAVEYNTTLFQLMNQAEKWLRAAVDVPPPVTSYYLRAPVYLFLPLLKLAELFANVFLYTGNADYYYRAREYYERLRERLPGNLEVAAQFDALAAKFREIRRTQFPARDRPAIAIFNTTGQFSDHLAARWSAAGYTENTWKQANADGSLWGDFLFSAWCDRNAVTLSREADRPLVVRLCRYEAYTDLPRQVVWDNVRALVVPSETMRRYVTDSFAISCPIRVIHHGLDLARYRFRRRLPGKNVAWIGYFHARKDPMLLLEIAEKCPDKIFHIAGVVQQQDLWRAFWQEARRRGIADRLRYHGWQADIDVFLDAVDASWLLSTSWGESFGYAIAEAMAKGIMPVIRRFEGAEELWPHEQLFAGAADAMALLSDDSCESERHRTWVADRYDADAEARAYLQLFAEGAPVTPLITPCLSTL